MTGTICFKTNTLSGIATLSKSFLSPAEKGLSVPESKSEVTKVVSIVKVAENEPNNIKSLKDYSFYLVSSRNHAYIILTSLNPILYSETGITGETLLFLFC